MPGYDLLGKSSVLVASSNIRGIAVRSGFWIFAISIACHSSGQQATMPSIYHSLAEAKAHVPAARPVLYVVDGVPLEDTTHLPSEDSIASVEFVEGSGCVDGRALMGGPCPLALMITTHRSHD
jgi:hypothetical protein